MSAAGIGALVVRAWPNVIQVRYVVSLFTRASIRLFASPVPTIICKHDVIPETGSTQRISTPPEGDRHLLVYHLSILIFELTDLNTVYVLSIVSRAVFKERGYGFNRMPTCHGSVSVCVSVCRKSVFCRNGRTDRDGLYARRLLRLCVHTLCRKDIRAHLKHGYFLSELCPKLRTSRKISPRHVHCR